MPPKSITTKITNKASILQPEYDHTAVGDILEWSQSISVSQPAQLYTHITPPTSLPPRPNFNLTISGRHNCGPHTTHQLLLVLSYLFISSMLPIDLKALWKVIYRHDPILANIELQTRYILFIIGQYTSPHSKYYQQTFLAFDPILLPKILTLLNKAEDITYSTEQNQLTNIERYLDRSKLTDLQTNPTFNTSTANLTLRLANIFTSLTLDRLDAAFQTICEIQQSKADKVVTIEMIHIKSFEEVYKLNRISKSL
ncbi:unnamed protein product [Penicillium salamii]|uniref:Uncharacterized protein n=1 Tax=Penicillium salamii TaxID=1612424 RepID=A0A9W4JIY7_9EURO|nr:unnamed protein product [Penicillium salamii]CAG8391121.1 unnamed protein product [Penicillium salamii]CAG8393642.1 unnamed protein product [Penicillium salamii]